MALADIKQAIAREASLEVAQIEADGKKELDAIRQEWGKKLQARKKIIQEDFKHQAEQKFRQERFVVIAEFKAKILEKKLEILDLVYQKAQDRLSAMSGTAYAGLIQKYVRLLPAEGGRLIAPKDQMLQLKKALGKSANKYSIEGGKIEGSGGFVYIGKDLEMDYSFGALISKAREDNVLEISKLLFDAKA